MIYFDTDGAGVDGAGFAGVFAFVLKFGGIARTEKTEGIEIAFEVSPLAVGAENALAFGVGGGGGFDYGGAGAAIGRFGFRSHSTGTSIKDAGRDSLDSRGKTQS